MVYLWKTTTLYSTFIMMLGWKKQSSLFISARVKTNNLFNISQNISLFCKEHLKGDNCSHLRLHSPCTAKFSFWIICASWTNRDQFMLLNKSKQTLLPYLSLLMVLTLANISTETLPPTKQRQINEKNPITRFPITWRFIFPHSWPLTAKWHLLFTSKHS